MVSSAATAAPATVPSDASTPEGMSSATTGRPAALIDSISVVAAGRGAPLNPVPNSASITTSAPRSVRRSCACDGRRCTGTPSRSATSRLPRDSGLSLVAGPVNSTSGSSPAANR